MYFVATRIVNSTINLYSLYIIKQLRQMKTIPLCWNLADVFLMVYWAYGVQGGRLPWASAVLINVLSTESGCCPELPESSSVFDFLKVTLCFPPFHIVVF